MTSFVLVSTDGEQLVVDDADVVAAVSTEVQAESIAVLIVVLCAALSAVLCPSSYRCKANLFTRI